MADVNTRFPVLTLDIRRPSWLVVAVAVVTIERYCDTPRKGKYPALARAGYSLLLLTQQTQGAISP